MATEPAHQTCPDCGATSPSCNRFCRGCGSLLAPATVACECGATLSAGQKFCRKCGAPVSGAERPNGGAKRKRSGRRKSGRPAAPAIAVIALVVVAVGGYFLLKSDVWERVVSDSPGRSSTGTTEARSTSADQADDLAGQLDLGRPATELSAIVGRWSARVVGAEARVGDSWLSMDVPGDEPFELQITKEGRRYWLVPPAGSPLRKVRLRSEEGRVVSDQKPPLVLSLSGEILEGTLEKAEWRMKIHATPI